MIKLKTNGRNIVILCLLVLCIACLTLSFGTGLTASAKEKAFSVQSGVVGEGVKYSDDSVIVVLNSDVSGVNKIHKESFFKGVEIERIVDLTKQEKYFSKQKEGFKQILQIFLKEKSKKSVLSAIDKLKKIKGVVSAEVNYQYEFEQVPDDDRYLSGELWGMNDTKGISAEKAWDLATGSRAVRVGIIDSGLAEHADLNANRADGWDFANNNSVTTDDIVKHGTHVAGTIGAVGDNDLGVVGVNWNVQLVSLQVAQGMGVNSSALISAINWAAGVWGTDEQVDVLNFSITGLGRSTGVRTAVSAYGGLFVWAAGNDSEDIDPLVSQNGSFNLSNIIAVGAINEENERPSFSNYSTNGINVNVYAPGEDILSTLPGNQYGVLSGTSMAAPHVTGVAALMLSVNPTLTAAQIKTLIMSNADEIEISIPGSSVPQTVKKLNAYKSVAAAALEIDQNGVITGVRSGATVSGTLNIPSEINGIAVTGIADEAFFNCWQISSVIIPEGVTSIGDYAFYWCSALQRVDIPSTVTSIGWKPFYTCDGLETVILRGTPVLSGPGAGDLGTFGYNMKIHVPVTNMSYFMGAYDWTDYRAYIEPLYYNVTSEGVLDAPFIPVNLYGQIIIPDEIVGITVRGIGDFAFNQFSAITSVILPETVTSIGVGAFCGCTSLSSINIPYGVTTIGEGAFAGDSSLATITIPSTVRSIGDFAFVGATGLTSITNESRTPQNIGSMTFASVVRANVDLYVPTSTMQAYIDAGWGGFNFIEPWETTYNATGLTISGSDFALEGDIVIPSSIGGVPVTAIGDSVFSYDFITSVTIPSSVTTIGSGAFCFCNNLTVVNLSNGLVSVGSGAFVYTRLTEIVIPSTVTSIGEQAFFGCYYLDKIVIRREGTVINLGNGDLGADNPNLRIYVPIQVANSYLNSSCWSDYTDLIRPFLPYSGAIYYIDSRSFTYYGNSALAAFDEIVLNYSYNTGSYVHGAFYNNDYISVQRVNGNSGFVDHGAHCELDLDKMPSLTIPNNFVSATLKINVGTMYNGNEVVCSNGGNYTVTNGLLEIDITAQFNTSPNSFIIMPKDASTNMIFYVGNASITLEYQVLLPLVF